MLRLLRTGYGVGDFCNDAAVQLLPIVHDEELKPIRGATGPSDGGGLNHQRSSLVGKSHMHLDVVAGIQRFLALDRAAIDRERGHEAHPRRSVGMENDWVAH